ncbi:MAG TPA: fimbria/pilus outer membrane usher protein [Steroidobacteraceae bacterium]|nr:fimbria/pilus outer membrane usher protein [Steroidobacteraceae bacterium]
MRALPIALALCAFGTCAAQADSEDLGFTPVVLDVRLNAQSDTTTLIVQRDPQGTLYVAAPDLAGLRLQPPLDAPRIIDGIPHHALDSFEGAEVRFDAATQSAEIMLSPDAFVPTRLGRQERIDVPITAARPGGFLNYDLAFAREAGDSSSGGQFELGFFDAASVVTSTFTATDADSSTRLTRLETTVTRDFPDRLASLRIGDAISASGAWGQAARFAGIQFASNYATQPTLVTTPLLGAEGVAVVPSTVDVFVNGQRMASEQVPPGPFTIDRLPAINGAGELQVVVTDVLGRQQIITQPYYSGAALLRAGLDQFSFELGTLRENFAIDSNRYGDVLASGTWRRGLTDDLTGELHFEAEGTRTAATGADAAWRLGRFGILSGTLAGSRSDHGTGWLAGTGFDHSGTRFTFFTRLQYASDRFALVGQEASAMQPKMRAFVGTGVRLGRAGTLTTAFASQSYWNADRVDTLSASWSWSVRDLGYLNLSATRAVSGTDSSTDVLLLFTMPLGSDHTASASLEHTPSRDRGDLEATATLQKSRPLGAGYGYYSMLSTSGDYALNYGLYGRAGTANLEIARRNEIDGWRVQGQGGVAFTEVGVMPARRLDQSFAVVEVADYAGLTVYLENHPIGQTDEQGRLLVDRLRPFEPNRISLDPTEVPMDASLQAKALTVRPAWRSGPIVRFPVERAHAATLRLLQEDGKPVPAGARVLFGGSEFAVALDGLVYLEGVVEDATAEARWAHQRCVFDVMRPEAAELVPDLGSVSCRPAADQTAP